MNEKLPDLTRRGIATAENIQKLMDALDKAQTEARENDGDGFAEYEGERLDVEALQARIAQLPLKVAMRSDWASCPDQWTPCEYSILLAWGGPACRITGFLGAYNQPETATLEMQDWGTPWTPVELSVEPDAAILAFAQEFFFEE